MPRAKQRTPELRLRVLDEALATLADRGVASFTTRKVAQAAGTSVPALYELFGDKAGLVREVFYEGFRRLAEAFDRERITDDPRADIETAVATFRQFAREHPPLAAVMFSRPFAAFDPGPDEARAGRAVREHLIGLVRRSIERGDLHGDATDIAHVLIALAQGLAAQEAAGWLGTSPVSMDRRWSVAVRALLDGLR